MSGSHKDRRRHRRKVAGSEKGLAEHQKRDVRRVRHNHFTRDIKPPGVCPACDSARTGNK